MTGKKNFALGYSMVFHSFLMYFFYVGLTTNGLNVIVGTYSAINGIDRELLLGASTPAALIGVLVSAIIAQIVMKRGVKKVTIICLIAGGILGTLLLGWVHSMTGYLLVMICANIFGCGYAQNTTNTLVANWFPRKKGFMFGLSTCGIALAGVLMVKTLSWGINMYGFRTSMTFIGLLMVVLGVISIFWIKDTPEEVGLYPDNIIPSQEEAKGALSMEGASQGGGWTVGLLLKNKITWLLMLGMGLLLVSTVAFASTAVYFLMENGLEQANALTLYSSLAILIFIGSAGIGWIDTRFGVRIGIIVYSIIVICGFAACLIFPIGQTRAIISAIFGLTASGAISNLAPSAVGSVYGRKAFASSIRVVGTGISILKAFTFVFVAFLVKMSGSYSNTYKIMTIVAIVGFILLMLVDYKKVLEPQKANKKIEA